MSSGQHFGSRSSAERGRRTFYLGVAPGVGDTTAMLTGTGCRPRAPSVEANVAPRGDLLARPTNRGGGQA